MRRTSRATSSRIASPSWAQRSTTSERAGTHSRDGSVAISRSASTYARGSPRSKKKGSAVDEPAIGRAGGFHHGLRQRRVAVDHPGDLGVAALQVLGVDELLDQLGGLRPDDVAAEQLAVLLVADDLDEAGAVAVDGPGADRAVLDLADDDVVPAIARLLLGQPERRHVRGA